MRPPSAPTCTVAPARARSWAGWRARSRTASRAHGTTSPSARRLPMSPRICVRSPDAAATQRWGERLGTLLRPGDVVALRGPLGAGKTCFVQGVARGLGVDPSLSVTSPTFTLIGEYPARIPLRHADFYRIESEERLFEIGFDDLLDGRGALLVEWAERWPNALPRDCL